MIRDFLKWLACGLVVVAGLVLVSWGPAGTPAGKARADHASGHKLAAAEGESPAAAGKRAQP
jgi:hypothetical protein